MEDILELYALPYDPQMKGWRHIETAEQRTRIDWEHQIDQLLTDYYPEAERIRLIMDNLNTHTLASLYMAFPAQKHEIWLNVWRFTIHRNTAVGSI